MLTVGLDIGTTASGSTWIQNRQPGNSLSTVLPISLNPIGGGVGIGTASVGYTLDVGSYGVDGGTIRIASSSSCAFRMMEANDTYGFSFTNVAASRMSIKRHSASQAGTEIISIMRDNSYVGIGTSAYLACPFTIYNPASTSTYTGTTAWGNLHLMPNGAENSWAGITFGASSAGTIQQSTQASITVDSNSSTGTNMRFNVGYLFASGALERMTILGATGRVGIGSTNPGYTLDCSTGTIQANQLRSPAGNYLTLVNGAGGSSISLQGTTTSITGGLVYINDPAGLSCVGTYLCQCYYGWNVYNGQGTQVVRINHATNSDTQGWNTNSAILFVGRANNTGRGINSGGTINANGADYAEYMTKSGDFTIKKGDVVGVNAQGLLTTVFADSVSFMVKSTDPSYVGGDTWGTEDALGIKCPETVPQKKDESDEDYAKRQRDLALFNAKLEEVRARVDRIAFAGQVPVNVLGATPGQYIIPVANEDGSISGQAVSNPTFEQYMAAIGKVIKVLPDGRAQIIVKVV
jgi:hypothetical protein